MSSSRDSWVVVRSSPDPVMTELARAALDNEKIESRLRNAMTASILPLHQAAIGGFELEVRVRDEEAARTCLAAFDASEQDDSLGSAPTESTRSDTDEGDAAMRRAAAAAVLGFLMCLGLGGIPALGILLANARHPTGPRGARFRAVAVVFSLLGFALLAYVIMVSAARR